MESTASAVHHHFCAFFARAKFATATVTDPRIGSPPPTGVAVTAYVPAPKYLRRTFALSVTGRPSPKSHRNDDAFALMIENVTSSPTRGACGPITITGGAGNGFG